MERKVEDHKVKVEEIIEKGIALTRGKPLAPDIVTDQVGTLVRLWNQVLELIIQRREELEENLDHWNNFVEQLETLLGKLNDYDGLLKEKGDSFTVVSEETAEEKMAEYKVRSNL